MVAVAQASAHLHHGIAGLLTLIVLGESVLWLVLAGLVAYSTAVSGRENT